MPRVVTLVLQRVVVAPLVIVLTVLMWTTLPLWLIGAGVLSQFVPGWLRPVRLLWLGVVHLTLESIILVELFGLWIASGFGLLIRNPFFERIHYDLVQTYLVVFFREATAGAAAEDRDRRSVAGRPSRASRCWCSAATQDRATRSS